MQLYFNGLDTEKVLEENEGIQQLWSLMLWIMRGVEGGQYGVTVFSTAWRRSLLLWIMRGMEGGQYGVTVLSTAWRRKQVLEDLREHPAV